jgi:phosphoribosyl 1,2-cyclic phosphate phosphodiesterase
LGTGTSHGVPLVGCGCATCTSTDPRNKRFRSSIWIKDRGTDIVIDTPAEFRIRSLEYNIMKINAILLTHAHADHVSGLDDIRIYNELQGGSMPVYCGKKTLSEVVTRFLYIFADTQEGGGKPKIDMMEVMPFVKFKVKDTLIEPIPVMHGDLSILGYKINNELAYITDCSRIPEETFKSLKNIKVLILDALRDTPHPTHFSLAQATEAAKIVGAERTYFTHIAHALEHVSTEEKMLPNMRLAYDGLTLIL